MIDSINISCIKAIKANFRWKLIVNGIFLKQGSFEKLINMEIFQVAGESYTKTMWYEKMFHVLGKFNKIL